MVCYVLRACVKAFEYLWMGNRDMQKWLWGIRLAGALIVAVVAFVADVADVAVAFDGVKSVNGRAPTTLLPPIITFTTLVTDVSVVSVMRFSMSRAKVGNGSSPLYLDDREGGPFVTILVTISRWRCGNMRGRKT
jgi:hypothetical protein